MKIYSSIEDCQNLRNPVITLGMYDGVHLGHQKIIQMLNNIAQEVNGESVLLTFYPHPRLVLQPDFPLQMLSTKQEKEVILENNHLDNLIFHPFTKDFSQVSAKDFVVDFLVKKLNVHTLVIGYDHHFEKNREGNFDQLLELSKEYNFNLKKIDEVKEENTAISSTKIRTALKDGDIAYVNKTLGHLYTLTGEVVHGDKIGRTLGFPTANLKLEPYKLIPKDGVYSVEVLVDNQKYLGLLSIGIRETVSNTKEHRVEVNILNFDGDLYGKKITVGLLDYIREEKKFNSLEDLILAMNADKTHALEKYPNY